MLAKRVIPCLNVDKGRVVKGTNFVDLVDAGDPIELAQRYDREGADEVVFLDITATSDDREPTIRLASRASEQLRIPYTVVYGVAPYGCVLMLLSYLANRFVPQFCKDVDIDVHLEDPELIMPAGDEKKN